jgi:hypothetical protein
MGIGISEAVDLTGRVAELIKKGATLEAQERIVDLREAVLAGKDEVLRLREENQQLREKIREQEEWESRAKVYALVETEGGAFVLRFSGEPGHYACPACFESKRIHILQDERSWGGTFKCSGCAKSFPIRRERNIDPYRPIR